MVVLRMLPGLNLSFSLNMMILLPSKVSCSIDRVLGKRCAATGTDFGRLGDFRAEMLCKHSQEQLYNQHERGSVNSKHKGLASSEQLEICFGV